MNLENAIDWFFRILQIFTFVILLIKISVQESYINNVKIESIEDPDAILNDQRFHFVRKFNHTENPLNFFVFYPEGTDVRKLEFFTLRDNGETTREEYCGRLENIDNHTAVLIRTTIMGVTPFLRIKWETVSGELGEYTVSLNGFNGNTDIRYYKYKLTWKRKILSIFSW